MGKIIRRTVTITITETWTIVWTTEDEPPRQATAIVPDQPKTQEAPDEALHATVMTTNPGDATASDPTAPPDGVPPKPSAGSQRKRTRSRHAER